MARSNRIKSIDMYHEINDLLGVVEEVPENITYIIDDSLSKDYIGKYKLVDGEMGTYFPKHLIKDSILEIGVKDRVLYVMKDEKFIQYHYIILKELIKMYCIQSRKTLYLFHLLDIMNFI